MARPIGIDLGTTFSCIATYRKGREEIIADKRGKKLIPSMIFVSPETGECVVGDTAYEAAPSCPKNLLKDAKRLIGRKFDDTVVQDMIESDETMYSLVKNQDDMVAFEVTVNGKKVLKTPEEVSSEVLKYLKSMAEDFFREKVSEAVISIPAYFSNSQRKATKRAAELAGFKVKRLITEPVAGALHYVQDRNINAKLLVFDWGGGTLDVSFIVVNNKTFEVKAVYGDTQLGGRNIDENLFKKFYRIVTRQPENFIRRLIHTCTVLKEHLSVTTSMTKIIEYYNGNDDLTLSLTRDEFNELNSEIFQRVNDILMYGLNDVGWSPKDVNEVVLVGGSTRICKIRDMLDSLFEKTKIKTDLSPDEAVAAGAAIQAAILLQSSEELEKYKVSEVTPLSVGLSGYGDLFTVFISKNSKLPVSETKSRISVYNNQDEVTFDIYEGERKNSKYNNKLGSFKIKELPLKRAGDVEFLVKFHLDEDGILTVSSSENSTGKNNKLVVTMSEFRLNERQIKLKVDEAKKAKHEDDLFEKFITRRNSLLKKCRQILYDIKNIKRKEDQDKVKEKCEDFVSVAERLDFLQIDDLETKFVLFRDVVYPLLRKYNMIEITE